MQGAIEAAIKLTVCGSRPVPVIATVPAVSGLSYARVAIPSQGSPSPFWSEMDVVRDGIRPRPLGNFDCKLSCRFVQPRINSDINKKLIVSSTLLPPFRRWNSEIPIPEKAIKNWKFSDVTKGITSCFLHRNYANFC